MRDAWVRLPAFTSALLASTAIVAPACAQTTPPVHVDVDQNGVDLVSGGFVTTITEGSIGSGEGAVTLSRSLIGSTNWVGNWTGGAFPQTSGGVTTVYIIFGSISEAFTQSGSTYISQAGSGATLTGAGGSYVYTGSDGTKISFTSTSDNGYPISGFACANYSTTSCSIPTRVVKPEGTTFTVNWTYADKCPQRDPDCTGGTSYYRFAGVTSSAGYGFNVNYSTDSPGSFSAPQSSWYYKKSVVFSNSNNQPVSPPTVTYPNPSSGYPDFSDPAGRPWHFTAGNGTPLTGIQRPGASSTSTSIFYSGSPQYVSAITRNGVTTTYARTVSGTTATTTITDAQSHQTMVVADLTKSRVTQITDSLKNVTAYGYDVNGRLTEVDYPEGNKAIYAYDDRGNIVSTTLKAKPSTGGTDIVTSANYPTSCTNAVTCNKPVWTKDAMSNETDYAYDANTGLVTNVTAPAPVSGGIQPQTRYSYTTNAAGVALLTGVSQCRTNASCAGASDEVRTTIAYNSNFLPTSVSKGSGDGSLTATAAMTYDGVGNVITVDGPLPGSADTTTLRYDADRERVGIVTPDPDGSGALKPRAVRVTYNADGQVTQTEVGTVTDASASAWSAFSSLQQAVSSYDANGRKLQDSMAAGGSTYSIMQYSFDSLGRPLCTAVRMNPAAFGNLPDACTAAPAGADGPDRIGYTHYDELGRVDYVTSAYGTGDAATERTSYTPNGKTATVTDANGNVTGYTYNGFDRQIRIDYPSPSAPGQANTGDWEGMAYFADGRLNQRRLRDGRVQIFGWDADRRLVSRQLYQSGLGIYDQTSYGYDLLGELLSAAQSSTGETVTFGYDALGRPVSDAQAQGTMTSGYDLAGRRTRLTWPDGTFVTYEYDPVGSMTAIRDGGAALLVSYGYDDLGRRTGIMRGNGTSTSYGYDAAGRLGTLTQDLNGTGSDVTFTFGYNAAGQITSRTASNDAYSFGGAVNTNRPYAVDGLNRYNSAGSVNFGYDALGNLTSSGSTSYSYDADNQLTGMGGGPTLGYDPLGRLDRITTSYTQGLLRDLNGAVVGTRYNNGGPYQRFVPGAGTDEPAVWLYPQYSLAPLYFHADERGSVIALSDKNGDLNGINRYDEHGIPNTADGGGMYGMFGYTGQLWVEPLGLYDYKARMYSPSLGRFMQTDPIGYGDGLNWYNYAHGDAINGIDPSGTRLRYVCVAGNCGYKDDGLPGPPQQLSVVSVPSSPMSPSGGGSAAAPTPPLPQNPQCPAPPSPGPGKATIDNNIADAKLDAAVNAADPFQDPFGVIGTLNNLEQLSLNVTSASSQNYKANPAYRGSAPYGNFNFGATMQARGFSLKTTLWGSNAFQRLTTGRADPPEDVRDVTNGYRYAQNGCNNRH